MCGCCRPKKRSENLLKNQSKTTYVKGEETSLLPPPIHFGKHFRETTVDFQLPYDIWWLYSREQVRLSNISCSPVYTDVRFIRISDKKSGLLFSVALNSLRQSIVLWNLTNVIVSRKRLSLFFSYLRGKNLDPNSEEYEPVSMLKYFCHCYNRYTILT